MTEQQLQELEAALADFLGQFLTCCVYAPTHRHLHTYTRGLLSDLPRKTAEPIALHAGTPARTLQEFLTQHAWDHDEARARLRRQAARLLPRLPDDGLGSVGLVDETSGPKKGKKTPGVGRQYLGCLGKVDNGIVTVHLGVARGRFKTLLDADLYLPTSWDDDRPRCRQAGIPDAIVYRPKWQIALEQLDRAKIDGVSLDWLTFDEEYGKAPGFIAGLDHRQQRFVGEVPRSFSCLAATRSGRPPVASTKGRGAQDVVRSASVFRGQAWQVLRLPRATMEDQVWRVKAGRIWLSSADGWSAGTYWLIWASNDETAEEKFFLSNAPEDTAVATMVRVAFRRWHVEHCFRVCKSELGFSHFEGRNYGALMRHLTLCLTAITFVAGHTERLGEKKSGLDDGAGVPGFGGVVPAVAVAAAGGDGTGVCDAGHRLPPGSEPGSPGVEEEAAGRAPEPQETTAAKAKTKKPKLRPIKVAL